MQVLISRRIKQLCIHRTTKFLLCTHQPAVCYYLFIRQKIGKLCIYQPAFLSALYSAVSRFVTFYSSAPGLLCCVHKPALLSTLFPSASWFVRSVCSSMSGFVTLTHQSIVCHSVLIGQRIFHSLYSSAKGFATLYSFSQPKGLLLCTQNPKALSLSSQPETI